MTDTDVYKILLGAFLAIFGGIVGKVFSVFIDEWRERKFCKRSIADELNEIKVVIEKFQETFTQTGQLVPTYLESLRANTESYDAFRHKLYLIWSETRRRDVITFYRDLKRTISEYEGKLGSLNTEQGTREGSNESIIGKFEALKGRAISLHKDLTKFP